MTGEGPPHDYNPYAPPVFVPTPPPLQSDSRGLAERSTRFAARLVDNLLFGLSLSPLLLGAIFGRSDPRWYATVVVPLLFAAYQSYLVAATGQSLAKQWFGLRIVRLDGGRAGFLSGVVAREWLVLLLGFVPVLGMLFRLADAILIFGDERRCLHDYLAGTQVIPATGNTLDRLT